MARLIPRDAAAALGHDTLRIIREGGYAAPSGTRVDIRESLARAVQNTVEYPPEETISRAQPGGARHAITVENATVLEVGHRMHADGPVAALNFASATVPGGGFLSGARAQEESIARSSGLHACLEKRGMYDYHRQRRDPMSSHYVIYSPEIPVFRTDQGELLEEPWHLSIVTCAAVDRYRVEEYAFDRLHEIPVVMTRRTARVLSVAAAHDHRRLILGAWGCGAFGLDPHMMAGIFADALSGPFRGVFDDIVFAITDWSAEQRFIGPFARVFAN